MISKKKQTKTEAIANQLRGEILEEKFQDGRLPSKLDLIGHFGVSHRTIDAVLKRLREEGLIRGVRGTGIFVKEQPKDVSNLTHRLVLMLLPRYSIYEYEPYDSLRDEALRCGLLPVNLMMPGSGNPLNLQEQATVTQLLRAPIRGVLYSGRSYWREPFLDNWKNIRSVALTDFDSEKEPPGSSVLLDFRAGGYMTARHFIEKGCRRLLILCGHLAPDVPKSKEYWRKHPTTLFMEGARKATGEAGIRPPEIYFVRKDPEKGNFSEEEFKGLADKYDGILSTIDGLAYESVGYAGKLGLRVPEDLMVSGCLDTVWSHGFAHQITTLGQNPAEMSRVAFRLLEAGGRQQVFVKPELIIRKSTER